MTFLELILSPFYILLFFLYFKRTRSSLDNEILKKYHRQGFWIKITAVFLFVLYYTYLTTGDSRDLYFTEGKNFYDLLLQDSSYWKYVFMKGKDFNETLISKPGSFGYFLQEGNFMVIRLTALISFFTFGQYLLISLFFGCFAYSGLWRLFLFFYERRPEMHKVFAISILFFPSVIFWSSGLMKDSLCIGALGWFTFSIGKLAAGKNIIKYGMITFVAAYLIWIIKVYILLAYAPFLLLFIFMNKVKLAKVNFFKLLFAFIIFGGIIFTFFKTYSSYQDELGAYAVENITTSIETLNHALSQTDRNKAESNFSLGAEFDGTLSGLIGMAPYAVAATFYRPFIWETRKLSQLMAAVESLVLIFFTLKIFFKIGPFRVLKYTFSDPMILFCLSFALVFGIFVGTSTINFGSLVRYKIPAMPFYCIGLFLIYAKAKARVKSKESTSAPQNGDPHLIILPALG